MTTLRRTCVGLLLGLLMLPGPAPAGSPVPLLCGTTPQFVDTFTVSAEWRDGQIYDIEWGQRGLSYQLLMSGMATPPHPTLSPEFPQACAEGTTLELSATSVNPNNARFGGHPILALRACLVVDVPPDGSRIDVLFSWQIDGAGATTGIPFQVRGTGRLNRCDTPPAFEFAAADADDLLTEAGADENNTAR